MSDERTMLPTAKRRQLARAEGRVAVSRHVSAAAILVVACLALATMSQAGLSSLAYLFESAWSEPFRQHGTNALWEDSSLTPTVLLGASVAFSVGGVCFVIAVLARLAQVGFMWVPQRVTPSFQHVNPVGRVSTLFSPGKILDLLQGLALIVAILGVVGWGLWTKRETIMVLAISPLRDAEFVWLKLVVGIASALCACVAVFALLDYAIQYYRFEQSLHMTPEEIRAEVQAVQGNPQVAAGRRGMQRHVREQHLG